MEKGEALIRIADILDGIYHELKKANLLLDKLATKEVSFTLPVPVRNPDDLVHK